MASDAVRLCMKNDGRTLTRETLEVCRSPVRDHRFSIIPHISHLAFDKPNASPLQEGTNVDRNACFVPFSSQKSRDCRTVYEYSVSDHGDIVAGMDSPNEPGKEGEDGTSKKVHDEKQRSESIACNDDFFFI